MEWIDTIVQGALLGGLYALFAAGLSLMFGVMRIVNIAHGDLIVLGGLSCAGSGAGPRHRPVRWRCRWSPSGCSFSAMCCSAAC